MARLVGQGDRNFPRAQTMLALYPAQCARLREDKRSRRAAASFDFSDVHRDQGRKRVGVVRPAVPAFPAKGSPRRRCASNADHLLSEPFGTCHVSVRLQPRGAVGQPGETKPQPGADDPGWGSSSNAPVLSGHTGVKTVQHHVLASSRSVRGRNWGKAQSDGGLHGCPGSMVSGGGLVALRSGDECRMVSVSAESAIS